MDNFEIQFNKGALMNSRNIMGIDTKLEYHFVDEIKA